MCWTEGCHTVLSAVTISSVGYLCEAIVHPCWATDDPYFLFQDLCYVTEQSLHRMNLLCTLIDYPYFVQPAILGPLQGEFSQTIHPGNDAVNSLLICDSLAVAGVNNPAFVAAANGRVNNCAAAAANNRELSGPLPDFRCGPQ